MRPELSHLHHVAVDTPHIDAACDAETSSEPALRSTVLRVGSLIARTPCSQPVLEQLPRLSRVFVVAFVRPHFERASCESRGQMVAAEGNHRPILFASHILQSSSVDRIMRVEFERRSKMSNNLIQTETNSESHFFSTMR